MLRNLFYAVICYAVWLTCVDISAYMAESDPLDITLLEGGQQELASAEMGPFAQVQSNIVQKNITDSDDVNIIASTSANQRENSPLLTIIYAWLTSQ